MKASEVLPISKTLKLLGHPIAYYPSIAIALDSVTAAIFLCQFLYWQGKQNNEDGWIYKTREEIKRETGLSRYEQEGARRRLKELGILEEKRTGIPARLYYKFNWKRLDELLCRFNEEGEEASFAEDAPASQLQNSQTVGGNSADLLAENQPTCGLESSQHNGGKPANYIYNNKITTENTTEITTETTTESINKQVGEEGEVGKISKEEEKEGQDEGNEDFSLEVELDDKVYVFKNAFEIYRLVYPHPLVLNSLTVDLLQKVDKLLKSPKISESRKKEIVTWWLKEASHKQLSPRTLYNVMRKESENGYYLKSKAERFLSEAEINYIHRMPENEEVLREIEDLAEQIKQKINWDEDLVVKVPLEAHLKKFADDFESYLKQKIGESLSSLKYKLGGETQYEVFYHPIYKWVAKEINRTKYIVYKKCKFYFYEFLNKWVDL